MSLLGTLTSRAGRSGDGLRVVLANVSARAVALIGVTVGTILVARLGGPAEVGIYALLRMLPGLVGVLCVCGLPGALAYFLAPSRRGLPQLAPTLALIATAGALLGTALWLVATPVIAPVFFPHYATTTVALAGLTVATQLLLTLGKTTLQGLNDQWGGDAIIAAEEVGFLPCYLGALAFGADGALSVVIGLGLADLLVGAAAWVRVAHRLDRGPRAMLRLLRGRPDRAVGRDVVGYGLRGQVGGVITLLNLRLDFVILDALVGPAALGAYAVASKYAELLRLPGTALTWVTYPRLAARSPETAARHARSLIRPTLLVVWVAAIPAFLLAGPVIHLLYGARFASAVLPAQILVVGMLVSGAAGVASGYLYARGRPGLNSVAFGVGLVVTTTLDLLLIPTYHAIGASIASTAAYLVTDLMLVGLLLRLTRPGPAPTVVPATTSPAVGSTP
ncbi:MAG: polysaccharide biosynthesis C-terminal domain-containing protein [Nocardioides sp.]